MYDGEVKIEEKVCSICGEKIQIEKTESGKVLGRQFKGTMENPKHISCSKQRARERRNEQVFY